MKKKLSILSGFILGLAPVMALAQITGPTGGLNRCASVGTGVGGTEITNILCKISDLLNFVVPILISLAVIYFIWGVATYVITGDEEAKKAGRDRIIFGIIGLLVIVTVWGLVRIVANTFGISQGSQNIVYPTVPF